MFEAASFTAAFSAFALLHDAEARRRVTARDAPRWVGWLLRMIAAGFWSISVLCWSAVEGKSAAIVVATAAISLSAAVFVLFVPKFPRLIRAFAILCAPATIVLAILGGAHV